MAHTQVSVKAIAGDIFGEIGVLCQMPQPYTVRTRDISQILRLRRTAIVNTVHSNKEDGPIIVKNFFSVKAIPSEKATPFFFSDIKILCDLLLTDRNWKVQKA